MTKKLYATRPSAISIRATLAAAITATLATGVLVTASFVAPVAAGTDPAGSPVSSFGSRGLSDACDPSGGLGQVVVQAGEGRILALSSNDLTVRACDPMTGDQDPSYGVNGSLDFTESLNSVAIAQDHDSVGLFFAGNSGSGSGCLKVGRIDPTGTGLDTGFAPPCYAATYDVGRIADISSSSALRVFGSCIAVVPGSDVSHEIFAASATDISTRNVG